MSFKPEDLTNEERAFLKVPGPYGEKARELVAERFKHEPIYAIGTRKLTAGEILQSGICDTVDTAPIQFESLGHSPAYQGDFKQARHNFKDHEIREFVNTLTAAAPGCRRDTISRIVLQFLKGDVK